MIDREDVHFSIYYEIPEEIFFSTLNSNIKTMLMYCNNFININTPSIILKKKTNDKEMFD